MWYFAWILGVLLACSLGIINGLWLEQVETNERDNKEGEQQNKQSSNTKITT
ncbi:MULTISPECIES: cytochrome bd-I oxidase subunit CydX [Psychromonas]|uniref:cytochrome bd-I oxidase subunit CydX n=1 Tax=Psychromonas TaxID=67572 RepID=UPI0004162235|nr:MULTISPECIES: cytochrome bd-I oxidase subunit CydX [Psychromonas]MBB1274276.1 cytochrome bd-I oxidase subunit CydX [Psychromonas sp. SR45-3]